MPETRNETYYESLRSTAVRVKNYKCFGDTQSGFDRLLPLNIIIGRNNAGKSALLDLAGNVVEPKEGFYKIAHLGRPPEVEVSTILREPDVRSVFRQETSGGGIPGNNHWEYGKAWVGASLTYELVTGKNTQQFVALDPPLAHKQNVEVHQNQLAKAAKCVLSGKRFKRLRSERDMQPEAADTQLSLKEDGAGATNIIQNYLNADSLPSHLVEITLLKALNEVFRPDSEFKRLVVQLTEAGEWELFLSEPSKGRVRLSHTGSGFKTILLVLVMLHMLPAVEHALPEEYVFAFEELENNLHPALQRRLVQYIRRYALENGCVVFMTTHSAVLIDQFSRDTKAQLIHVQHDGREASTRCVQTYIENCGILDDLDVRASDLLQANCIVWVEGPSDRTYFNRWIHLWTDGALQEGTHYQCAFYGGRLLAHVSAASPRTECANIDGCVSFLRINRNAVILVDSDRSSASTRLNGTKRRIIEEVRDVGGETWVTTGREIENYLTLSVIARCFPGKKLSREIGRYESMDDYLKTQVGEREGKRYTRNKVGFATRVCEVLTKDDVMQSRPLADHVRTVACRIREWNSLSS